MILAIIELLLIKQGFLGTEIKEQSFNEHQIAGTHNGLILRTNTL
jgi:hypothetical protein